ncbi:hypothetical protein NF867_13755 [Solitalea sp. MAHUQ-68]|uniref:Uncharacterized protein n=1 Tax=Solitalea agri TaxID=2953739 RepID=A0A9X2F471_9SPHI|nr:hypothetical protein [Solitalea agri]MCO4293925.1 hypothetical protein [Solitalea agri]
MIDITNVDEFETEALTKSFDCLNKNNAIEVLKEPRDIQYIYSMFDPFNVFSSTYNVNFKNILKITAPNGVFYLVQVELKRARQYSPKYGQLSKEIEYQIWGCANLRQTFGNILLQPNELVDDFLTRLLSKLLSKAQLLFPDNSHLNKRYSISYSDREKAIIFFNEDVLKKAMMCNYLNIALKGETIIAGFPRLISVDNTKKLENFFSTIQHLVT